MTRRLVLVAMSVALLASACASSGQTLDEYADALTTETDAYVVESQNLSYDYQSGVEDGARELLATDVDDPETAVTTLFRQGTVEYLALLTDAMLRYLTALKAMEPPSDVAEAHDAFVSAVTAVGDAIPDAKAAVEEASDLDGIQRGLTASGFADGQFRWTATCQSLEAAIVDAGRAMDLRCVRPPETGGTP